MGMLRGSWSPMMVLGTSCSFGGAVSSGWHSTPPLSVPGTGGARSKRHKGGIESVSGISSASLTPTPQLFQVLEEQKAGNRGNILFPYTLKTFSALIN